MLIKLDIWLYRWQDFQMFTQPSVKLSSRSFSLTFTSNLKNKIMIQLAYYQSALHILFCFFFCMCQFWIVNIYFKCAGIASWALHMSISIET